MTLIAIDGPAGSGKSTLAMLLSRRLGYLYLDTGAMYRAVAYLALRDGVALDDAASLAALARSAHLAFAANGHVMAEEQDVSEEIRRPAVSAAVRVTVIAWSCQPEGPSSLVTGLTVSRPMLSESARTLLAASSYSASTAWLPSPVPRSQVLLAL